VAGRWGGIVSRTTTTAIGTYASAVLAGTHFDDKPLTSRGEFFSDFAEDEGLVIRKGIEYSSDKHLGRNG
jgi:hypothetical protein